MSEIQISVVLSLSFSPLAHHCLFKLQVYYECLGLGDPLSLKSPRAQRLYSHLRHPVCLELAVVLWLLPALPLDRLILAGGLCTYLGLAHSLDTQDCEYLSVQLHSKLNLFSMSPEGQAGSTNHKQDWGLSVSLSGKRRQQQLYQSKLQAIHNNWYFLYERNL